MNKLQIDLSALTGEDRARGERLLMLTPNASQTGCATCGASETVGSALITKTILGVVVRSRSVRLCAQCFAGRQTDYKALSGGAEPGGSFRADAAIAIAADGATAR